MPLVKFMITMKRPSGLGPPLDIKGKEIDIAKLSLGDMDDRARETERYLSRVLGLVVTIDVDRPGVTIIQPNLKVKM